jgi:hypothetical protein
MRWGEWAASGAAAAHRPRRPPRGGRGDAGRGGGGAPRGVRLLDLAGAHARPGHHQRRPDVRRVPSALH